MGAAEEQHSSRTHLPVSPMSSEETKLDWSAWSTLWRSSSFFPSSGWTSLLIFMRWFLLPFDWFFRLQGEYFWNFFDICCQTRFTCTPFIYISFVCTSFIWTRFIWTRFIWIWFIWTVYLDSVHFDTVHLNIIHLDIVHLHTIHLDTIFSFYVESCKPMWDLASRCNEYALRECIAPRGIPLSKN